MDANSSLLLGGEVRPAQSGLQSLRVTSGTYRGMAAIECVGRSVKHSSSPIVSAYEDQCWYAADGSGRLESIVVRLAEEPLLGRGGA